MLTTLSWIANAFIITGLYLVGNKKRGAFLYTITGETLWLVAAIGWQLWSMAFVCAIFVGLAVRNYIKWKPTL